MDRMNGMARENAQLDIQRVHKFLRKRSRMFGVKLNPELVKLLDETIKQDEEVDSRNSLIEQFVLQYLSEKGVL